MSPLKPIKRDPALWPLSRHHHHALLLCWKIKTGFSRSIPATRIKAYADWFYREHITGHFALEEEYIFPVLGNQNKLVQQALAEHQLLHSLFSDQSNHEHALGQIKAELEKHIRFEERTLFNEIQLAVTPGQLAQISLVHMDEVFIDNVTDPFWV